MSKSKKKINKREIKNDENTMEKYNLHGACALITGGAGLLGEKHAEAILEGGGKAVLIDINKEKLQEKTARLSKEFGKDKVRGYIADITNENEIKKLVVKIEKEYAPIDILINNAANNPHVTSKGGTNFARLENFPLDVWNKDFAVGVTGAFILCKYIAPLMAKRGKGVILNIASELGIVAPDQRLYRKDGLKDDEQPVKPVSYSIVKHGIIGLTKYLATYWLNGKVRANAVAFGGVYNNQPQEFLDRINKLSPLGRMARKDEYKGVVLFLCSEASSFMTGSVVQIDGGRTCW